MMEPGTEVVTVGPLTVDGVATLVADGLGVEPDPAFAAACWEVTGGTPFPGPHARRRFAERSASPRISSSAGKMRDVATATPWGDGRCCAATPEVPDATRLARAVAILERAELDQAARLAGLALPDAARAADLLVRAGVLDEAPLGFAHPLLRGAVYRDIAAVDRSEAHGRAAMLLAEAHASPAGVAEHLLATAPASDLWAVEQLRSAAREATARGAPESAAAYLRRAIAEPPSADRDPDLLLELGLAEFSAGQPGWHDHLEGATEAADDDASRTAAALLVANGLGYYQRMAEAVEVCDRVAARLEGQRRGPSDAGGHGGCLRAD